MSTISVRDLKKMSAKQWLKLADKSGLPQSNGNSAQVPTLSQPVQAAQ